MSPNSISRRSARINLRRAAGRLAAILLFVALIVSQAIQPTSALASGFSARWVQTNQPTQLWSGPNLSAIGYGVIPPASYLLVVGTKQLTRLYVYVPWTQNYAYVDATSVVPSSAPPPVPTPAAPTPPVPTSTVPVPATPTPAAPTPVVPTGAPQPLLPLATESWTGTVVAGGARIRVGPSVQSTVIRQDPPGTVVNVVAWVAGDQITPLDWTWAKLADGTYAYGEALQIIPPTTPPPPPASHPAGQWIDVNTLLETAVAYNGNTPVYLAIASTGSPGWETQPGVHQILRRVANETMDSSTLVGLTMAQEAEANYHLTNVLYTQYFDDNADALHDNYWLPAARFGIPHSHGCVGLQLTDAAWFWNWATFGTTVIVHNG